MIKNIKQFLFISGLLLIAAGAQPAISAVYQWSTTAANNATADPTINWSEGMSPSSVNDSARAMMAAIATARRDWQGVSSSGGTASAITFTSNQGFSSLAAMDGQMVTMAITTANSAGATLNVDGLGAKAIVLDAAGTVIPAGLLVAGTPYSFVYYNSVNQFRLIGVYGNPYNTPLGGYLYSSVATVPNSNFVVANGQCISRTTYAAYFALVSTTYGACDGITTFGVPDHQGRAPVMVDGGTGRMTSSASGCGSTFTAPGATCANGNQSKTLVALNIPTITSSNAAQAITVTTTVSGIPLNAFGSSRPTGGGFTQTFDSVSATTGAATSTGSNNISVTSNNTGPTAFPSVQPSYGVQVFVRVL